MSEWLASPKKFAPGTKMTFAGLCEPQDRANVIAYLNAHRAHRAAAAAPAEAACAAPEDGCGATRRQAAGTRVPGNRPQRPKDAAAARQVAAATRPSRLERRRWRAATPPPSPIISPSCRPNARAVVEHVRDAVNAAIPAGYVERHGLGHDRLGGPAGGLSRHLQRPAIGLCRAGRAEELQLALSELRLRLAGTDRTLEATLSPRRQEARHGQELPALQRKPATRRGCHGDEIASATPAQFIAIREEARMPQDAASRPRNNRGRSSRLRRRPRTSGTGRGRGARSRLPRPARRNRPPGSRIRAPNSRIGSGRTLPVWIRVSSSNISSNVPNPPGNTATARARSRKCILRSAK